MTNEFVVWARKGRDWRSQNQFARLLSAETFAFRYMESSDDPVEIRHGDVVVMRGQNGCARNYKPYNDILRVWCKKDMMPVEKFCGQCQCKW